MATTISADQARDLGNSFQEISEQLNTYKTKNWSSLTSEERQKLKDLAASVSNYSDSLITDAVGITLDAAKASLANIQQATTDAKKVIETINNIKKVITIAGAVIKLGAAFAAKDPAMIGSAVKDIFSTIKF